VLENAKLEALGEISAPGVSMTMRGIWGVRADAYDKLADRIRKGEL
jgi:hypothetical protein